MVGVFAMSNSALEMLDLFKTLLGKLSEKPVRTGTGEKREGIRF